MRNIKPWEFLKFFLPLLSFVVILCLFVILPPFITLEQSELAKSLDRCQKTIQLEAKTLSVIAKDWAEWNDTYQFVQDGNKEYIEDNLPWDYLNEDLSLDTLYVIGLDGHIVWGETSGIEADTATDLPQELLTSILPQGSIFNRTLAEKTVSGVFSAADGYWLIAANQIVQSSGKGPAIGIMVFGKFLSPSYISTLSKQLQLNFTLQGAPQNASAETQWYPQNSGEFQAFQHINDLAESDSTWIAITASRNIYNQGLKVALLSGAILILLGIGFTILWIKLSGQTTALQNASAELTEQQKLLVKAQQLGKLGSWKYAPETKTFFGTAIGNLIYGIPDGFNARYPELLRRVHPEDRKYFDQHWKAALKTGKLDITHRIVVNKTIKWVREKAEIELNDKGEATGGVGFTQDITEQKNDENQRLKLESQLRQKNKMEAVGFLAGGMAHNFNNNLSIILGNVELSQMKQPEESEVIQLLENAKTAVRRSRDLVQKIITYSRKGMTHKAPMKIQAVVDDTIDLLSSTLPTTVILQKNYNSDCCDDLINADVSQIQEALINLASNAVRAMEEKGDLKISLEPVELEQKNIPAQYDGLPGRYLKLSVQDSGCGMPAEMIDKIFDPFYSTKEDYEGAGMGLATVQGIVAQHGGIIKVNSVLSQGTEFDLYFPIMGKTDIDKPEVGESTFARGTERILFVDDDENLASLGEQLLGSLGYQVSIMTDSSEALKMFTANADQFDLVITDQTMPYITGKELITDIRQVRADIPTILCTGYSSKIDEHEAAELGINAFLMKPLDLPLLSQTIRRVLDGDKVC